MNTLKRNEKLTFGNYHLVQPGDRLLLNTIVYPNVEVEAIRHVDLGVGPADGRPHIEVRIPGESKPMPGGGWLYTCFTFLGRQSSPAASEKVRQAVEEAIVINTDPDFGKVLLRIRDELRDYSK